MNNTLTAQAKSAASPTRFSVFRFGPESESSRKPGRIPRQGAPNTRSRGENQCRSK
jgi:hypothetical protein